MATSTSASPSRRAKLARSRSARLAAADPGGGASSSVSATAVMLRFAASTSSGSHVSTGLDGRTASCVSIWTPKAVLAASQNGSIKLLARFAGRSAAGASRALRVAPDLAVDWDRREGVEGVEAESSGAGAWEELLELARRWASSSQTSLSNISINSLAITSTVSSRLRVRVEAKGACRVAAARCKGLEPPIEACSASGCGDGGRRSPTSLSAANCPAVSAETEDDGSVWSLASDDSDPGLDLPNPDAATPACEAVAECASRTEASAAVGCASDEPSGKEQGSESALDWPSWPSSMKSGTNDLGAIGVGCCKAGSPALAARAAWTVSRTRSSMIDDAISSATWDLSLDSTLRRSASPRSKRSSSSSVRSRPSDSSASAPAKPWPVSQAAPPSGGEARLLRKEAERDSCHSIA
mmetsp:Transcript_118833/g.341165  ORF Transcript_118833/g.341165 Transcript_118833/m.341165 type:complete len:412 (-) Transcript_118833:39-1274(-)